MYQPPPPSPPPPAAESPGCTESGSLSRPPVSRLWNGMEEWMVLASQVSGRSGQIGASEAMQGERKMGMEAPVTSVAGGAPASCVSSLPGRAPGLIPIKTCESSSLLLRAAGPRVHASSVRAVHSFLGHAAFLSSGNSLIYLGVPGAPDQHTSPIWELFHVIYPASEVGSKNRAGNQEVLFFPSATCCNLKRGSCPFRVLVSKCVGKDNDFQ